jgi:hypothetical protein
MLGEGTVLFGVLSVRGPGRVARNHLESFAQFAENENVSSALSLTLVDRRPRAGEGRKMRRASSRDGDYAVNQFSPHYLRRRELVLPGTPARLTMFGFS